MRIILWCVIFHISDLVCVLRDPCLNGATCTEVDGVSANCTCTEGYEGDRCETGT